MNEITQQMHAMYMRGFTTTEVGECFSVSSKAVLNRFKRAKLPMRTQVQAKNLKLKMHGEMACRLYASGFSVREVAKHLEIGATTVRVWLRKLDVKIRSVSEAKQGQIPAASTLAASIRKRRICTLPNRDNTRYAVTRRGHVRIWQPETRNYVAEHRLVMEAHLGRKLHPNEKIRHKNGNGQDNDIQNLEIVGTP